MRTLVILRGPSRSGRTTFVSRSGLEPWHIEQKALERMLTDPVLSKHGTMGMDRFQRNRAKGRLRDILRDKFARGALVLFEPCDSGAPASRSTVSTADRMISEVIEDAQAWRYRVVILDFTDAVSAPELEARADHAPAEFGMGPNKAAILRSQAHLRRRVGLGALRGVEWLTPASVGADGKGLLDLLEPARIDLSAFPNLVAIGDIHGCYATLRRLIGPEGPRDDVAYIFLGDYISKGPRSAQVLSYLMDNFEGRENAFFFAGNHERPLEDWVNARPIAKRAFCDTTLPDFEARRFAKRDARRFLSMLRDAAWLDWGELRILATHGGFARPPAHLVTLSAEHLQHGPETTLYDIDGAWEAGVLNGQVPPPSEMIQIHGHRNNHFRPVAAAAGSYNLEGGIDAGGAMRAVILRRDSTGKIHTSTLEVPNAEARSGSAEASSPAQEERFHDASLPEIM